MDLEGKDMSGVVHMEEETRENANEEKKRKLAFLKKTSRARRESRRKESSHRQNEGRGKKNDRLSENKNQKRGDGDGVRFPKILSVPR